MKRRGKGHVNQERWLISYADFITLLFAFFVVLYAFAKEDQHKQQLVRESVDQAFRQMGVLADATRKLKSGTQQSAAGNSGSSKPLSAVVNDDVQSPQKVRDDLTRIQHELEQTLAPQLATHAVSLTMERDGLVISLREAGFFNSGSATPKPETLPTLNEIAKSLGRTAYDLRVEGHTDNVPIHTAAFDSNWELSSTRATRIARLFLELGSIPAERISAAGFAEYHPVASNDTAEGRAQNRRVDLVVMPRVHLNLAAGATPQGASPGTWAKITDN